MADFTQLHQNDVAVFAGLEAYFAMESGQSLAFNAGRNLSYLDPFSRATEQSKWVCGFSINDGREPSC